MSRLSLSRADLNFAEESLKRVASIVGKCIGRALALHVYDFVSVQGLHCWRAFISEPDVDFVTANHFSWVPAASSRQDAMLRLLNYCFIFFKVDSTEELELKLSVLGRRAVMSMLKIKEHF